MAKLLSDADVFGVPPATGGILSDDDVFGSGQQNQAGGFMPAAKQAIGAGIKGLGQAATDFIPGVEKGNALSSYGQSVIDANQTAIRSLGDIADKPWTAVKEATGNAGGSMASMLGARGVGMAMTAAAPFTGPFAPVVAGAGQLVANVGPFVAAALPSYGGIRGEQIAADPLNEQDARSKAIALLGAGTVGAIEGSFGPQAWALAAMKKGGIEAVAKNFAAAKSLPGFIGKGALKGAAVEGAEELVQNPVEQLASYQDPTTGKNVADTAFSGAMGAIGGGVLGGGMAGVSYGSREQQPTTPQQPAPQPVAPPSGPMGKAAVTAQQSGAADAAAMQQAMQDQAAFDEHQARQAKQKGATNEQKAAQGPIEDAGQSISGAPAGLAGQGSEIGASANVGAGQRGRSADSDEVLAGVAPSQTIGQPPIVQPQAEAQATAPIQQGEITPDGTQAKEAEQATQGRPAQPATAANADGNASIAGYPAGEEPANAVQGHRGKRPAVSGSAQGHLSSSRVGGDAAEVAEQATQGRPAQPATAANAAGVGIAGDKLNREWTAFSEDSGTLGIPRSEMPQVKAEHRGALANFLTARGVTQQKEEVPADSLLPTQAEFSPSKVKKAAGFVGGDRSILVSADNHVLDGHHQWMAKRESGEAIKIIRLNAPIKQLVDLAHAFPSSETANGATPSLAVPPQPTTSAGPLPQQAVAMPVKDALSGDRISGAKAVPTNKESLSVAPTTSEGSRQTAVENPQLREAPKTAPGIAEPAIDVSTRTDKQLAYLSTNGRNGYKEAAIAEIARRAGGNVSTPIPATSSLQGPPASWILRNKETKEVVADEFEAIARAASILPSDLWGVIVDRSVHAENMDFMSLVEADAQAAALGDRARQLADAWLDRDQKRRKSAELAIPFVKDSGLRVGDVVEYEAQHVGIPKSTGTVLETNPDGSVTISTKDGRKMLRSDVRVKFTAVQPSQDNKTGQTPATAGDSALLSSGQGKETGGSLPKPTLAERKAAALERRKAKEAATKADTKSIAIPDTQELVRRLSVYEKTFSDLVDVKYANLNDPESFAHKDALFLSGLTGSGLLRARVAAGKFATEKPGIVLERNDKTKPTKAAEARTIAARAPEVASLADRLKAAAATAVGSRKAALEARLVRLEAAKQSASDAAKPAAVPQSATDDQNAARKAETREPWEMTRDEFAEDALNKNEYADAYRKDEKLKKEFLDDQRGAWVKALVNRAEHGRIPDNVLDDFVEKYGLDSMVREFRGVHEKGVEGYLIPDVRNAPRRPDPVRTTWDKEKYERTWAEERSIVKTLDSLPKTPAYWREAKDEHRKAISKANYEGRTIPDKVKSDYPELFPAKKSETESAGAARAKESAEEPKALKDQDSFVGDQLSRFEAGNFSVPRASANLAGGKYAKDTTEEMNRRYWEAYNEAAKQFLEGDLTAKVPGARAETLRNHELRNVKPKPITKNVGVAKTLDAKLKALAPVAGDKTEVRTYLQGVHVEDSGRLVATNGNQMAVVDGVSLDGLPAKPEDDKQFHYTVLGNDGKWIDGKFPDYERVMPTKHATNPETVSVTDLGNYARGVRKAAGYSHSKFVALPLHVGNNKGFFEARLIEAMANAFRSFGHEAVSISVETYGNDTKKLYAVSKDGTMRQVVMGMNGDVDADQTFAPFVVGAKADEASKPTAEGGKQNGEGGKSAVEGGKLAGVYGYSSQPESFQWAAKEVGGAVVYSRGDIALVEGFSPFGNAVYAGVKGDSRTRADISAYTGKMFSETEKAELEKAKADHVKEQGRLHEKAPDGPFSNGARFAKADGVSDELAGVAQKWLSMLGIKSRVFLATKADVSSVAAIDKYNLRGPFSAIRSAGTQNEADGGKRTLPNGDHYIIIPKSARKSHALEALAHEIGHILESDEWKGADRATKDAVMADYQRWLDTAGNTKAVDWVKQLRAHTSGKLTRVATSETADRLPPYWRSFGEYFADQVSRWATTSDKPLTAVDTFFKRIALAMRRLYAMAAGKPYLPGPAMKAYLDARGEASPLSISGNPTVEGGKPSGEVVGWLDELFGTPEQQAEDKKQYEAKEAERKATIKANADTVRAAISEQIDRATKEREEWAAKVYKRNKTQVEFRGDGPARHESMSIGAINESRRRNAIEALTKELSELKKLDDEVSTDDGAVIVFANLNRIMEQAIGAVESGNWPGRTNESMFEEILLSDMKFRGPGGRGSVTSNGLSRAMLAVVQAQQPTAEAAPAKAPEAKGGEADTATINDFGETSEVVKQNKQNGQAAKLRAAGKKIIADADDASGRDRLTNTPKRAREASYAEATAAQNKVIGETMLRIADAIEDGSAKALAGITARTQVEQLDSIMRAAIYASDSKEGGYEQTQRNQGRPFADGDLPAIKMPGSASWISGAKSSLIEAIAGKRGAPALRAEILRADGYTQAIHDKVRKLLSESDIKNAVGWHAPEMVAKGARLARAGITNISQLRSAISEYAKIRAAKTETNRAKVLERALIGQKVGIDFFPTPKAVATDMVRMADIQPGMKVLEPSAGNGNIAEAIQAAGVSPDVVELSSSLREILDAKGFNLVGQDFMQVGGKYDRIVMNPPFSNRLDAEHVQHAYTLLNPGGKIVAIMGEGVFFGSDTKAKQFRDWLDSVGGTSEKLPEGTFTDRTLMATTGVNSRMVEIDKPAREGVGNQSSQATITPSDSAIYDMAREGKSAQEILEFIGASARRRFDRHLANALMNLGVKSTIKLDMFSGWKISQALPGKRYAAAYSPKTDTVAIFTPRGATQSILHELVHAATLKALANPRSRAAIEMRRLFKHVQDNGQADGMYGMRNVDEFVAEAFSNPKFQQALMSIPAPRGSSLKSAWEWFVGVVARMLGMRRPAQATALDRAMVLGAAVMNENAAIAGNATGGNLNREADAENVSGNVSGDISDTITIDGVERPRMNSNGKPIAQTDEALRKFYAWFGSSRVTDEQGRPLVVYHGSKENFSVFDSSFSDPTMRGIGFHVTSEKRRAAAFSGGAEPMALYVSMSSPLQAGRGFNGRLEQEHGKYESAKAVSAMKAKGYDGLEFSTPEGKHFAPFDAGQLKSATGENNEFSPDNPDIRFNAAHDWISDNSPKSVRSVVANAMHSDKATSWITPFNTQYHKAEKWAAEGKPLFKKVFDLGQRFLSDVSRFAVMAQQQAPTLFHEIKSVADAKESLSNIKSWGDLTGKNHRADVDAIAAPLYEGTLYGGGSPAKGVIFSDDRLRQTYKLTDRQIKLYREALAAAGTSMDEMAKSVIARHAKQNGIDFDNALDIADMAEEVIQQLEEEKARVQKALIESQMSILKQMEGENGITGEEAEKQMRKLLATIEKQSERLDKTIKDIAGIVAKNRQLQDHGYFPLMRFGDHTVTAKDDDGNTQFFGMYEGVPLVPRSGQYQANKVAEAIRAEHPEWTVTTGIHNTEKYKLYEGMNLEAVQLFAEHMDKESLEPFQEFLRVATNDRSIMKRLIHRKGTPGFDRDIRRTLSQFIVSNARHTSSSYHMGDMRKAAEAAEQDGGDIGSEAIRLYEYVSKPREEAQAIRGYLFFNFIGGSIASAMVNLSQVPMMTFPYLTRYEGAGALGRRLTVAARMAIKDPAKITGSLGAALQRAEQDGVTAPQEIHQLTATAANNIFAGSRVANGFLRAWGAPFAMAESFNRRTTFIAAFQIAEKMTHQDLMATGTKSAFEFAEKAVTDTQGIYNKGNRMNVGRGAPGAVIMTFKQFSIMYLELLKRMPPKQRAVMLGMLLLAAGGGGLPFEDDAEDIIDTIGQWLGFGTNASKTLSNAASSALGERTADILLKGAASQMGIDLHSRFSMGNLIPGTGALKLSSIDKSRDAVEVFGPAASVVQGVAKALENIATGHEWRAAMAVAPNAIKNLDKGVTMAATGYGEDEKGRRTVPTNELESLAKAIGFNPKAVADYGQIKRDIAQDNRMVQVKREEFTSAISDAILSGDTEARKEAMAAVRKWNLDNPKMIVVINPASVSKRVRDARAEGADRFLKTVSRPMRADAREALKP